MARQSLGELKEQYGRVELVPVLRPGPAQAGTSLDLRARLEQLPVRRSSWAAAGMGLCGLGFLLANLNPIGFFGYVIASSMLTTGGGLVFLGLWKGQGKPPAAAEVSAGVLQERCRRIRQVFAAAQEQGRSELTFEALRQRLPWTEMALLDSLIHMQQTAEIQEDLDLDSGEWVYRRAASLEAAPLMLEDRRANLSAKDREE